MSLQEAVDHRGQRIEAFSIDAWDQSRWHQVDEQTTVGHKRLLRLRSPVTTDQVRIRITGSRLEPTLAALGLFKQAELVRAPVVSERDAEGQVKITDEQGLPIVYTTDNTMPTSHSEAYRSPIALPRGGTVTAACVAPDGRIGMTASMQFVGYAPTGWEVAAVNGRNPARLTMPPTRSMPIRRPSGRRAKRHRHIP